MQQTLLNPLAQGLSLTELAHMASVCTRCELSATRIQAVFSDGNPQASIMLVGEGPGQNEDETGLPFVGRAGQLLTQMLASVGLDRQRDLYICNVVKCRPPQNRKPKPAEMAACFPYLEAQIQAVQPKIILLAGATAVQDVLKTKQGITQIRGQWFETPYRAKAMPIFHPSYLLRNPSSKPGSPKALMLADLETVKLEMDKLGIPLGAYPA
ncbi:uracil-DNA glycosylase family protein [Vampirovibrio sp.]|uniref:uracil-DNA glycosylase n=1 Tax=Vampirovibrio sp. TaxID=2717857 RepID=UPI003594458E